MKVRALWEKSARLLSADELRARRLRRAPDLESGVDFEIQRRGADRSGFELSRSEDAVTTDFVNGESLRQLPTGHYCVA